MQRRSLIALAVLGLTVAAVREAQAAVSVSVGIGLPGVQIGINVPVFPALEPVPDCPVYYAPGLSYNYFFYDGLYWVYQSDNWYQASWYDGPWVLVRPSFVPLFLLRVPVRYYRAPPPYFRPWAPAQPPRWGTYYGPGWAQAHPGWNRWDRHNLPPRAPLPTYQRDYGGDRYPGRDQQHNIRDQQYGNWRPNDPRTRPYWNRPQPGPSRPPAQGGRPLPQRPPAQSQPRPPQGNRPARPPQQNPPRPSQGGAQRPPQRPSQPARPQPAPARPPQQAQPRPPQTGPQRPPQQGQQRPPQKQTRPVEKDKREQSR